MNNCAHNSVYAFMPFSVASGNEVLVGQQSLLQYIEERNSNLFLLQRFGSGVTSSPNFKFPSRFKTFCLGGRLGIFFKGPFFVSGGRGRTAIESNRISRLRCCTQSVLATFSFLHKKSLSTTSTQFYRKKKNKKLANRGTMHISSYHRCFNYSAKFEKMTNWLKQENVKFERIVFFLLNHG